MDEKKENVEKNHLLSLTEKKLLTLLKRVMNNKDVIDKNNLYLFLDMMLKGKIPSHLIEYIYNYLYQRNNNDKIDIKYNKDEICLIEKQSSGRIIYSIIQTDNKIADIKKRSICIRITKDSIYALKSVSFALDSAIDLVVLNTEVSSYDLNEDITNILKKELKRKDFDIIGFLSKDAYPLYDTVRIDGDIMNNVSSLKDGILKEMDKKSKLNVYVNVTNYTRNTLGYLKELKQIDKKIVYDSLNKDDISKKISNDEDIVYFAKNLRELSHGIDSVNKRTK